LIDCDNDIAVAVAYCHLPSLLQHLLIVIVVVSIMMWKALLLALAIVAATSASSADPWAPVDAAITQGIKTQAYPGCVALVGNEAVWSESITCLHNWTGSMQCGCNALVVATGCDVLEGVRQLHLWHPSSFQWWLQPNDVSCCM
jgi:hypothetical protein